MPCEIVPCICWKMICYPDFVYIHLHFRQQNIICKDINFINNFNSLPMSKFEYGTTCLTLTSLRHKKIYLIQLIKPKCRVYSSESTILTWLHPEIWGVVGWLDFAHSTLLDKPTALQDNIQICCLIQKSNAN